MRRISPQPPSVAAASEAISAKGAFITKTNMYPVTCANIYKLATTTNKHNHGAPPFRLPRSARTRVGRRSRLPYRAHNLKIVSESPKSGECDCACIMHALMLSCSCCGGGGLRRLWLPQKLHKTEACAHPRHIPGVKQGPWLKDSCGHPGVKGEARTEDADPCRK